MATPTSQGFIQIDDGVVLQDDGRHAVPGLVLAERAGIYAAGQNPDAGPDRVRLTDDRGRFAALVEDSAQPPHVVEAHDGSLWVCSWLKSGAWVAGYQPSDIPWGNETGPHPPEPPDPGPEPPEPGPEPGADPPSVTISSYAPTLGRGAARGPRGRHDQRRQRAGGDVHLALARGGRLGLDGRGHQPELGPRPYVHVHAAGDYEIALQASGPGRRRSDRPVAARRRQPRHPAPPEPTHA